MRLRFKAYLRWYEEDELEGDDVDWASMGIEKTKKEPNHIDKLSYIEFDPFIDVIRSNPTKDGARSTIFLKNGERVVIEHTHESYCKVLGIMDFEHFENLTNEAVEKARLLESSYVHNSGKEESA